jgi:hypothetical protein
MVGALYIHMRSDDLRHLKRGKCVPAKESGS